MIKAGRRIPHNCTHKTSIVLNSYKYIKVLVAYWRAQFTKLDIQLNYTYL